MRSPQKKMIAISRKIKNKKNSRRKCLKRLTSMKPYKYTIKLYKLIITSLRAWMGNIFNIRGWYCYYIRWSFWLLKGQGNKGGAVYAIIGKQILHIFLFF
jgi:hypothetical protein